MNGTNPIQKVIDDQFVIGRWCGYHGGIVNANKYDFFKHIHQCEKERCDMQYGDQK